MKKKINSRKASRLSNIISYDKSRNSWRFVIFGFGIYALSSKSYWVPFSIRYGFRKTIRFNGYFIEFLYPQWITRMRNIIGWQSSGEKNTYKKITNQKHLNTKRGK